MNSKAISSRVPAGPPRQKCRVKEIRLSLKRFRRDEQITNAETDFTHATYFLADWFEGAENLDKAQSEHKLYSRLRAFWKQLSWRLKPCRY